MKPAKTELASPLNIVIVYSLLLGKMVTWLRKAMVGDYRHNSIFDFRKCYYVLHCNEFYVCLNFMLVLSIF